MEPWLAKLREGDAVGAWDLFIDRYQRLIFATIRHYAEDYDDVMDVFAWVCEALREDDLRRLRCYHERAPEASFPTYLATVVRNLTIDWFRHRAGRTRVKATAEALPQLQRKIFEYIALGSHSHIEAYELIRARDGIQLTFAEFQRHLTAMYRTLSKAPMRRLMRELTGPPAGDADLGMEDDPAASDTAQRLGEALALLPADVRAALELFVIEELPAADVARIVGWPGPKAVYNRVYRALAMLRASLVRRGIGRGDL